jgi:glycosyltransferase involved in cell wall biosynthesis
VDKFIGHAVQPSIGEEGFSVTIIEAMSCAKPVVATPSGGTTEILQDGEAGFIVPKRDEKLLAEKIIVLIKNKDMAAEMGAKAREKVIAEYTWQKVVSRLIAVYERVLNGNPILS